MEEIWKPIIIEKDCVVYNYEGLYEVSNMGRVRSLDRVDSLGREVKGEIMKPRINNLGYQAVGLRKNSKRKFFYIHRLVATMFIPNPDNLPVVNHRDYNPSNNCVENLEWCTQKYNVQYSSHKRKGQKRSEETKRKISENHADNSGGKHPQARKVICLETKQVFGCVKEAGEWCNGAKSNISKCCQGKRNTAGKHPGTGQRLHWQYLDDYLRELRLQSDVRNSGLVA